jgi:predicted nucleotidyltransferase
MLQKLFSSEVRVLLLTYFYSHPDEQFYARELARQLGQHYNAVWRELNNLEGIGLLSSEQTGGIKLYRLNREFPIYEELKRIIFKTTALGQVLRTALDPLGRVECAFIYGSVANASDDRLSDIDLMLVGQVDLMSPSEAIANVESQLGRAVNYLAMSREEMARRASEGDPFLSNVLSGPKIMLIGEENGLREIATAGAH